jgi:hypothetical protein
MRFKLFWYAAAVLLFGASRLVLAATLYSDDFNTNTSANYNVNITPGATGPSSDATFLYDYSALGIPAAPHTTGASTLGLRLRVDNLQSSTSANAVGAIDVATKGLTLPATYTMSVDVWGNYIGGTNISGSGTNGTTGVGMGIGTAGTSLQSPNGNDGLFVSAFHDGGNTPASNSDYRVYATTLPRPTPTTTPYFAAGTGAGSADNLDPYYAFLTSHTAPGAQTTISAATQGGSTPVGIVGFAWHTFTLTQDSLNVTWSIDGHVITTVPDSAIPGTFGGSNVSLGSFDGSLTGSSAANNQLFNADIFDNLTISDAPAVPEPGTLLLCLIAANGLLGLRRRG